MRAAADPGLLPRPASLSGDVAPSVPPTQQLAECAISASRVDAKKHGDAAAGAAAQRGEGAAAQGVAPGRAAAQRQVEQQRSAELRQVEQQRIAEKEELLKELLQLSQKKHECEIRALATEQRAKERAAELLRAKGSLSFRGAMGGCGSAGQPHAFVGLDRALRLAML